MPIRESSLRKQGPILRALSIRPWRMGPGSKQVRFADLAGTTPMFADLHRMGLAAAALDMGRRFVARDQVPGEVEQAFRQHLGALGQLLR
jgi:hypothetical protein